MSTPEWTTGRVPLINPETGRLPDEYVPQAVADALEVLPPLVQEANTSASNAATSASNASTSASNAATSASEADGFRQDAETAAQEAADLIEHQGVTATVDPEDSRVLRLRFPVWRRDPDQYHALILPVLTGV